MNSQYQSEEIAGVIQILRSYNRNSKLVSSFFSIRMPLNILGIIKTSFVRVPDKKQLGFFIAFYSCIITFLFFLFINQNVTFLTNIFIATFTGLSLGYLSTGFYCVFRTEFSIGIIRSISQLKNIIIENENNSSSKDRIQIFFENFDSNPRNAVKNRILVEYIVDLAINELSSKELPHEIPNNIFYLNR